MIQFSLQPQGPFNLLHESQFFGGWLTLNEGNRIVMPMSIEGWTDSAAVVLSQDIDGKIHGDVYSHKDVAEKAWLQALSSLSLDVDGSNWAMVGDRDPFIGKLQKEYDYLRPILFYTPYEAAISLLIGHRISIRQRRAIMQRLSEEFGEKFTISGSDFYAFPDPHKLLTIHEIKGLNEEKVIRIHGAAQAALDGMLDRAYLRSLPTDEALKKLLALRGVGAFFSQGILFRGAGIVDSFTEDTNTIQAIQQAYGMKDSLDKEQLSKIAEPWHPYAMWAVVLLHVWMRREMGGFRSTH